MPKRDYIRPSKKNGNGNKWIIIAVVAALLLLATSFLWVLTSKAPEPVNQQAEQEQVTAPASVLPSRPEERYSYIRELETREVPVEGENAQAQLTEEQKALLKKRQEEERARAEAILNGEQVPETATTETTDPATTAENATETATAETNTASETAQSLTEGTTEGATTATTPATEPTAASLADQEAKRKAEEAKRKAIAKRKAEEKKKKLAAEKRRKAEEAKKLAEKRKAEEAKKAKEAQAKKETKTPATAGGRFGLQCGAFKSKDQAENMYARLTMAGFNARISSASGWNRVIVGPVGDRAAAKEMATRAKTVAECFVIGM